RPCWGRGGARVGRGERRGEPLNGLVEARAVRAVGAVVIARAIALDTHAGDSPGRTVAAEPAARAHHGAQAESARLARFGETMAGRDDAGSAAGTVVGTPARRARVRTDARAHGREGRKRASAHQAAGGARAQ